MRVATSRFFLLLITLFLQNPLAYATEKVTWIVQKFEPYYILEGPLQGQGAADRILDLIQKELPDLQHENTFMPILRIREALKNKDHVVCISFLKDPTLDQDVQYSVATMLVPALEISMRDDVWQSKWNKSATISIREFLSRGAVIGIAEGRHYGDQIDPLLNDRQHYPNGIYARNGNHYAGLADMVASRHIDATIGYSAELRFLQKQHPELNSLVSIPITENMQALYAYAILPKGEWGEQFRQKLNRAILKVRSSAKYKRAMSDWFGDTPAWEREYQSHFVNGSMDGASAGY
jgi:uncharacterized protein (TIGR02285 family)